MLNQYNLRLLTENCKNCCQSKDGDEDSGDSAKVKKYPKARLEVCGWKLGAFPQVQAFVKSDRPGKFPNFSVKYVGGQMPQIKLIEADDSVAETLSITKWDTDTIVEFLQTYLLSPSETSDSDDDDIDTNDKPVAEDKQSSEEDNIRNNEL